MASLAWHLPLLLGEALLSARINTVRFGSTKVAMKNRLITILGVLALSGALSISALAQTTDEGPAPSDQPSAPMEIGQAPGPDAQPNYSQPSNGQMGYPQPGDAPSSDAE